MLMQTGERWHCTNPACRCEVLVESDGAIHGDNPRCACGGAMKKNYTPPVFKYLEFLRVQGAGIALELSGGAGEDRAHEAYPAHKD